jgi:transportin-3
VPVADVVNSPLLNNIFSALDNDGLSNPPRIVWCAIFKETREVDEYLSTIQVLLPSVVALRPRIAASCQQEDTDIYKGVTRIFAEAGEAWVVLIASEPTSSAHL